MAPGFLSKFVRSSPSPSTRERSERSLESPRNSTSPVIARSRAASTVAVNSSSNTPSPSSSNINPVSKINTSQVVNANLSPSTTTVDSTDSGTHPSVTIIPPSPLVNNPDLPPNDSYPDLPVFGHRQIDGLPGLANNSAPRSRTTSASAAAKSSTAITEDTVPTPTATRPRSPVGNPQGTQPQFPSQSQPQSRSVTPSSSLANLRDATTKQKDTASPPMPNNLKPPYEVRRQASNKSLKQPPQISTSHIRSATAPVPAQTSEESSQGQDVSINVTMTPIVESPTSASTNFPTISAQTESTGTNGSSTLNVSRDTDSVSVISNITNSPPNGMVKEKKRPWRRSTAARKPTGLASAIAASGLAMANPTLSAAHQAQFSPPASIQPTGSAPRKMSNAGSPPYMSRSPTSSSSHTKHGSADLSPHSSRSKRSLVISPRRRTSVSVHSDNNSEYPIDDRPDYYSGLEEGSSDEGGSESDDDLLDLDMGEDDIPVTGFAVASNRRNADFHELFPAIPEGDYLIEDYGCALQREILIQGRIYISENHICFHANIFGWITDLSVPIYEITGLERKMTAFVIPNAIQITTRQAKYTFASFLSRDTTYDVIYNIWRLARPGYTNSVMSSPRGSTDGRPSLEHIVESSALEPNGLAKLSTIPARKATQCACGKEGKHYSETALETVVPGTPDRIHNLVFASGFMKDFMAVNQKLLDIQISDWSPTAPGSKLLTRNMSYIKPLNGSLGPKQTKCEIKDETMYCDFDDYVATLTTTRTPDVPSGGVFSVKTRTCIMWASAVSSKIIVTTEVEWTGRSFIKGIIERSAIEGQKVYHADLERAVKAYIQEHQSEFVPEGVDPAVITITEVAPPATTETPALTKGTEPLTEDERKKREHERNQRGLQWAWDTFDGAYQVARQSTKGALELLKDAWEQSTSTAILYFVIVILVFSNLWTLMRMGSREEVGRKKEMRKIEEREKWVQGVVTALWDELASGKKPLVGETVGLGPGLTQGGSPTALPGDWQKEVASLHTALDAVEARARVIRDSLGAVESLHTLD